MTIRLATIKILILVLLYRPRVASAQGVCVGTATACEELFGPEPCPVEGSVDGSGGDLLCATLVDKCLYLCQRQDVAGYNSPCSCLNANFGCDDEGGCSLDLICDGTPECTVLTNALDCSTTDGCEWVSSDDPPVPIPTNLPTSSPADAIDSARLQAAREYLINQGISSQADLDSVGSPQFNALQLMAESGTFRLEIPEGDIDTPEGYEFITRYIMTTIYHSTNGEEWRNQLNFTKPISVCMWRSLFQFSDQSVRFLGVSCNRTTNQVHGLYLPHMNATGTLPTEMGFLTSLRTVILDDNIELGGPWPDLSRLTNMETLTASFCRFNGTIPSWITSLKKIRNLSLAFNDLSGMLPRNLSALEDLFAVAFDHNLLTGDTSSIWEPETSSLGLRELVHFYVEGNLLTGTIDGNFLRDSSNLTFLDISDNQLSGVIPGHLFLFSQLFVMDLHDNLFVSLPEDLPQNTVLDMLAVQKCNLNETIPASISMLRNLRHLDLSQNQFTGVIPTGIGTLTKLTYLFLAQNEFLSNPVPEWVQGLTSLVELSLKTTQRTGPLPSFLSDLDRLWLLDLDDNSLQGTIPNSITTLSRLSILTLNRNQLTGPIPSSFSQTSNLELIFLEGNAGLSGNLGDLFCDNPNYAMDPPTIVASCQLCNQHPDCCAICCSNGEACNPGTFVPDLDPIWQYSFRRVYTFLFQDDQFDQESSSTGNTSDSMAAMIRSIVP
ncbi:serine threonine-protein kinase BRI1-like [Seminavis robusta]|uniref:Serine threonine-protein kinase BRI1-like n=1 Tax=Seminavis robusta TaxID=568900 RepID=A0A9N8EEK7_9STRA|nr:serine threonine-protein kinase BRI1-like [Seminavis robusta]|eukprot:Sro826_g207720.1 serine threonine-protein kinase BRI1-like (720) ;mRNA; f:23133-25492